MSIFRYVLSHNNLTGLIPLQNSALRVNSHRKAIEIKHEVDKDKKGKIKADKRTKKYFQEVEKSRVRYIYNLYKPDFELFQYSADEFL